MGVLSVAACVLWLGLVAAAQNATDRTQSSRMLPMFTMVRFPNGECTSAGDDSEVGTCYAKHECVIGGGSLQGPCAKGYGSCCINKIGCGGISNLNNTYLESPGYPNTFNYATMCSKKIMFINDNICQIRLDVVDLTLSAPASSGMCFGDKLSFSHDNKYADVCGKTLNNHFYLDVDYSTSSYIEFKFDIGSDNFERRWKIRVSQIACDSTARAPGGCGQYFTGWSGTMRSWNADGGDDDMYMHNMNYAICLRQELNQCSTTYSQTGSNWFVPRCPDYFEYPFVFFTTSDTTIVCSRDTILPATSAKTVTHQGPHIFYINSEDGSNRHDQLPIIQNNIDLSFTKNECT